MKKKRNNISLSFNQEQKLVTRFRSVMVCCVIMPAIALIIILNMSQTRKARAAATYPSAYFTNESK